MNKKDQYELIDRLQSRGKMTKLQATGAKILASTGDVLKKTFLNNFVDIDFIAENQTGGFVNIAKKAKNQRGLVGVNLGGKITGNQVQGVGIQGASTVGGNQGQLIGIQVADNIEPERQLQGINIQVSRQVEEKQGMKAKKIKVGTPIVSLTLNKETVSNIKSNATDKNNNHTVGDMSQ